jgi:mitochondrial fission protein ELM1
MAFRVSDRVWACSSPADRSGDLDQVHAIAWALDPRYRIVDLAHEFERLQHAREHPGIGDRIEWPRYIVGIGGRRLEAARTIRQWSLGRTELVHIGRLRCSLDDLDYLVTTPAYPLPPSRKVFSLDIALSDKVRRMVSDADGGAPLPGERQLARTLSEHGIRPNWINVFVGNPLRGDLGTALIRLRTLARHLDRLAARYDRDLVVSGAPRTQPELYDVLASNLSCRRYLYRWTANDPCNPFELMLRRSRDSVVTSDSVSMISQLVAAGHRTLVFPWRARSPLIGTLTKRIRKRRSKDTAAFRENLYGRGLAAELCGKADFERVVPQPGMQDELLWRLRSFIR